VIIYNPTDKPIEFRCAGKSRVILAKESITATSAEANVMLDPRKVKGLVEYTESLSCGEDMKITDMNYKTMPWRELVKVASSRRLYKPGAGLKKEALIKLMEDYDQKEGIIQKSPN